MILFAYRQRQKIRHRAKKAASTVAHFLRAFGIDLQMTVEALRGIGDYISDRRRYIRAATRADLAEFPLARAYPCLTDRHASNGSARGHYFHQDLLVAQRIFHANPSRHLDVGSRFDGFVAHVASYRQIDVLDIRPLNSSVPNVTFHQADITSEISPQLAGKFDSVSCLHALEHFGLGRYGDPILPGAYLLGLGNLARLLSNGGTLYLSVPIGAQRIEFNAHRVFSVQYLLGLLHAEFDIAQFSFVDDNGDLHVDVAITNEHVSRNFGCFYGCGIFELRKKGTAQTN